MYRRTKKTILSSSPQMGLSCSRLGSRPYRSRDNRTNRSNLCSFICGASSSRAIHQMEDSTAQFHVHSTEHCGHNIDGVQSPTNRSYSIASTRTGLPSVSTYSENSIVVCEEQCAVGDPRNIDVNIHGKGLFQSKESARLQQVSADYSHDESHRYSNTANGTSFKGRQSSEPVSVNILANEDAVNGIDSSVDKGVSPVCSRVMRAASSSTTQDQEVGDFCSNELIGYIQEDEVTADRNLDAESPLCGSDLPVTFQSLGDESSQATPSGLESLVADDREQGQGYDSMSHVDVVDISSNSLPTSSNDANYLEARRNSRRLFWDAFSRRSFRRHNESAFVFPSYNVSNTGDPDRWLLDISGDFIDDEVSGDSRHFGSRIHILNEQQRHSRSQIWERLRSSLSENGRQSSSCPSGIHPDGACSCDSFSRIEHSSTRASISRIIMLAEALFEVLDDIHGQPVSLALSMVSLPAPESVVDSFPLKNHEKTANGGDDIEQCYICLAEYEDGDKIRVLPCRHEYHMSCVDKWLKEIHGVCPLCRGDVCAGSNGECSVSNSEIPTI